jgi:S-(hydroxymethyl)glutathione dehydrogenase/alcohol dehydrogenase
MKTVAAVLVELNCPLEITEIEIPSLDHGQVLVRVLCTGICGSQLGEIAGVKGPDRFLPHLLGHEACGEVQECGAGVKTVSPGQRVVLHWRPGAGVQSEPPVYNSSSLGKVNGGWVTTFNELAVVSENRMTPVAPDLDPGIASLMGCAVTTGLGVINRDANVCIGESVVVWGAGGIGLSIVQGAALASAWPIIAIDLYEEKLTLAKTLGATHCINAGNEDVSAAVRNITGADGADVVIDNTGDTEVITTAYQLTHASGRTVLVGVPRHGNEASFYTLPLHFGKQIVGSHGGQARPDRDIPRYVRLFEEGKLALRPLLTHEFELHEINNALDAMRSGQVTGRCVVNMPD